jgi:hypothetical protein
MRLGTPGDGGTSAAGPEVGALGTHRGRKLGSTGGDLAENRRSPRRVGSKILKDPAADGSSSRDGTIDSEPVVVSNFADSALNLA